MCMDSEIYTYIHQKEKPNHTVSCKQIQHHSLQQYPGNWSLKYLKYILLLDHQILLKQEVPFSYTFQLSIAVNRFHMS